jgi:beta-glucanase (GH16 family)
MPFMNTKTRWSSFWLLLPAAIVLVGASFNKHTPHAPQLIWADEFDYTGLPDSSKWNYDLGGDGWGNHELQYYTSKRAENARVENGNLIIEARKEKWQNNDYTSARLLSKGKADWQYGKIEVRARLPKGTGTWPAIWMLGSNTPLKWPDDGEIDIMEHVGFHQGYISRIGALQKILPQHRYTKNRYGGSKRLLRKISCI